jgi:phage-related protein (TIGR01555 family)
MARSPLNVVGSAPTVSANLKQKKAAEEAQKVQQRISAYQALRALSNASPRKRISKEKFIKLFTPAIPPPGVLPKGQDAKKLAMDEWGWSDGAIGNFVGGSNYYASSYAEGQQFLGYGVLAVLAQRAEYRVITETLASDMTREWIRFDTAKNSKADKSDKIAELEDYLDNLKLKAAFKSGIENDGFQGRGQIYVDLGVDIEAVGTNSASTSELRTSIGNGRDDASKAKIKKGSLERLVSIEPMWTYPYQYNASQPLRRDWYNPTTWFVMGTEVHRTRLITFIGRPVPDLLKPAYSFGGLSMTQMAKPYVDFWLRDRTSASDLLNGFSTMVLMTTLDVSSISMASGNELYERIETFNAIRDNMGLLVLNKATEDFKNVSASLGGLHELVAQAQEHIASVAQIPTAKLLGIQPAGLNADSEGIIRLYYDRIKAFQESLLREPLTTIIDIAQMSLWGEVDRDIIFHFNDLWQLDEAGKGAIQLTKAQIIETDIASGIISPEEGREARAADPDSPYTNLDLSEGEAPGQQMEEEQEEGGEGGEGGPEGEGAKGPIAPKDQPEIANREQRTVESQAANFGGGATGGFTAAHDEWNENDHPRGGNPENPGQFSEGAGSGSEAKLTPPEDQGIITNSLYDAAKRRDRFQIESYIETYGKNNPESHIAVYGKKLLSELGPETSEETESRKKREAERASAREAQKQRDITRAIEHGEQLKKERKNRTAASDYIDNLLQNEALLLIGDPDRAIAEIHQAGFTVAQLKKDAMRRGLLTSQPENEEEAILLNDNPDLYREKFKERNEEADSNWGTLNRLEEREEYLALSENLGKFGTKKISAYKKGFPSAAVKSLRQYKDVESEFYEVLNSDLSAGGKISGSVKKVVSGLDKLFDSPGAVATEDFTVYRGLGLEPDQIAQILKTGIMENPGFPSTSFTKATATEFADNNGKGDAVPVLLNIKVAKGQKAVYVEPLLSEAEQSGEQEVLLPRGSKFKVVGSSESKNGRTTLDVETIEDPAASQSFDAWTEEARRKSLETRRGGASSSAIPLSGLKKVGGQLGSNPGGKYEDSNGKQYYVKLSKSNDHAKNEILASRLYQAAGSPILDAIPVELGEGKIGTATEWKPGVSLINRKDPDQKKEAQENFATHVWLANWDAAGLEYDNQGMVDGKMTTLDPGGSLLYRAQGSPKGGAFGDKANEWTSLRDSSNPQAYNVFGSMTDAQLKQSAQKVTSIPNEKIEKLVEEFGPGDAAQKKSMTSKLIARRDDIARRVAQLAHDTAMDKSSKWEEHLHPRDEEGKFTANGGAHAGMVDLLKYAGFAKHPESTTQTELYHHPSGHSVGFTGSVSKATTNNEFAHYLNNKFVQKGYGNKQLQAILDEAKKTGAKPSETKAAQAVGKITLPPNPHSGYQVKMFNFALSGDLESLKEMSPISESAQAYQKQLLKDLEGGAAPTKKEPPKLTEPHPDSENQKKLYALAKAGDLTSLKAQIGLHNPSSFTYKYGMQLLKELGANAPASTEAPKPEENLSTPPVSSKRYQRAKEAYAKAKQFSSTKAEGASAAVPSLKSNFWDNLPSTARSAFSSYTGSAYDEINEALRKWGSANPSVVKKIDAMDEAFEHESSATTEDVIVRRGEMVPADMVAKWAETLKSGIPVRFTKDGFISTSLANKAAFSGNTYFEMVVKKGTKAIGVDTISGHNEDEVLLRHGQSFEVFEIEKINVYGKEQHIVRMVTI